MTSAVVLLSGGQDSTTCLYWAKQMYGEVHALTMWYGQRHDTEIQAATTIAKMAECTSHKVLHLSVLEDIGDSDLVRKDTEIQADGGYGDEAAPNGLPTSFVPGRNMLFLAAAASYAVKVGATRIVTGVCQTDYSGYPDCRREFIDAMEQAATLAMPSTCGPIKVCTPLMYMTKADTVRMACGLPGCWDALAHSMTCYNGTRCGKCPACVLRAQGFAEAGLEDPA